MTPEMTPQEAEAIKLVWAKEGRTESPIPPEDVVRILAEIRERVARIERAALEVGMKTIRERRQSPGRPQWFFLMWITIAGSVIAIYYFLSKL